MLRPWIQIVCILPRRLSSWMIWRIRITDRYHVTRLCRIQWECFRSLWEQVLSHPWQWCDYHNLLYQLFRWAFCWAIRKMSPNILGFACFCVGAPYWRDPMAFLQSNYAWLRHSTYRIRQRLFLPWQFGHPMLWWCVRVCKICSQSCNDLFLYLLGQDWHSACCVLTI